MVFGNFAVRPLTNTFNRIRHSGQVDRKLEIGPGPKRIPGFETLNVMAAPNVDYIADAARPLPFKTGTFSLIYASHVLEHIPWYKAHGALSEWVRILKSRGALEIWVPNGLRICQTWVDYETSGIDRTELDGWYRFNPERDPCKWAAGRIFTYGDGTGRPDGPNWHRSIYSPRFLRRLMEEAGLEDVHELDRSEVRGHDHGWINLGMRGRKP